MKELKFRGIEFIYNKFVYAENNYSKEGVNYSLSTFFKLVDNLKINRDTIQQFTGLQDKNGNDIYEGDILQYGLRRSVVEFIKNGFKAVSKIQQSNQGDKGWFKQIGLIDDIWSDCEVIGNIFENKELLN